MEYDYMSDSADDNVQPTIVARNDFMDLNVKGTSLDYAGGSIPEEYHLNEWSNQQLESEYLSSGLAHKIVSKPAEDATRNGFRIVIPDNPELQAEYQKALDMLDLRTKLSEQLIYRSLYGDGFISIGVKDGSRNVYNPINTDTLESVEFVHAFSPKHVKKVQLDTNPISDSYLKEIKLVLDAPKSADNVDKNGNIDPRQMEDLNSVTIDATRYCRASLDKLEDEDSGSSILNRCRDALQTMDSALFASIKLVRDFNLKIYKSRALTSERDPKKRQRYRNELELGLTTSSLLAIAEDEDYQNVSTNVSGIDKIYDFAWQNIASASGIPKSVLTGEQAGTLAGASQDIINYYDGVKVVQEEILKPEIKYITQLLMYSSNVANGVDDPEQLDWDIEFMPLWSADDKTQSESTLNYAQTGKMLVDCGAYDPDEARRMFESMANNKNISAIQNTSGSYDKADMFHDKLDILDEDYANAKVNIQEYIQKLTSVRGADNEVN